MRYVVASAGQDLSSLPPAAPPRRSFHRPNPYFFPRTTLKRRRSERISHADSLNLETGLFFFKCLPSRGFVPSSSLGFSCLLTIRSCPRHSWDARTGEGGFFVLSKPYCLVFFYLLPLFLFFWCSLVTRIKMEEFEATQIMEMSDNDDNSDDCNAEKDEQALAHFVRVLPLVMSFQSPL